MASNKDYDNFFNEYLRNNGGSNYLGARYPRSAVRKSDPTLASAAHDYAKTKLGKLDGNLSAADRQYMNADDATREKLDAQREATDAINDMYGIGNGGGGMAMPEMYGGNSGNDNGNSYGLAPNAKQDLIHDEKETPKEEEPEVGEEEGDDDGGNSSEDGEEPSDKAGKDPRKNGGAYDEYNDAGGGLSKNAHDLERNAAKNALMDAAEAEETAAVVAWPYILIVLGIIIGILLLILLLSALSKAFPGDKCNNSTANQAGSGNNVIVLDPGHISENDVKDDGSPLDKGNPGGSGNGLEEYKVTWKLANALKPRLEKDGYKVILTRTSEGAFVSNKARSEVANSNNALLLFRIHDDDTSSSVSGFTYYYPSHSGTINQASGGAKGPSADVISKSKAATQAIYQATQSEFTKAGMPDLGVKTDDAAGNAAKNGGVLRGSIFSQVPTSLIELGNLKNVNDAKWLKNSGNITKFADIMAKGIEAAAPIQAGSTAATTTATSKSYFPVSGTQRAYSGSTKASGQPRAPMNSAMVRLSASNAFFEWPLPTLKWPFSKYKNKTGTNSDEPNFGACRGGSSSNNQLCWRQHFGADIYAAFGSPVVAPESGKIITISSSHATDTTEATGGGQGRKIILKGSSGETYTFMHLEGFSDAVLKGAGLHDQMSHTDASKSVSIAVNAGDVIAYVGNTGGIQNPHLHFELGPSGSQKDPASTLDSWLSGTALAPLTKASASQDSCSTVDATVNNGNIGQAVVDIGRTVIGKKDILYSQATSCNGDYGSSKYQPPKHCITYDCSSFVSWAWYWGSNRKIKLGGTTTAMWSLYHSHPADFTVVNNIKDLQPGDLLLMQGHVELATGKGTALEFSTTGNPGKEVTLDSSYVSYMKGRGVIYLRPVVK